jgi:hypothetical protein
MRKDGRNVLNACTLNLNSFNVLLRSSQSFFNLVCTNVDVNSGLESELAEEYSSSPAAISIC